MGCYGTGLWGGRAYRVGGDMAGVMGWEGLCGAMGRGYGVVGQGYVVAGATGLWGKVMGSRGGAMGCYGARLWGGQGHEVLWGGFMGLRG